MDEIGQRLQKLKLYKRIMRFNLPFLREFVVLNEVEDCKLPERDASTKEQNDNWTKAWIAKRTQHVPGSLLPFQEVYRDYTFDFYNLDKEVTNESRFSRLVIETYNELGIIVGRRRVENRASFTDLAFAHHPPGVVGFPGGAEIGRVVGVGF